MEEHTKKLSLLCRFCGNKLDPFKRNSRRRSSVSKYSYKDQFLSLAVDLSGDQDDVHPEHVCHSCRILLDKLRSNVEFSKTTNKRPTFWSAHEVENCRVCFDVRGRPTKRESRKTIEDSETESASECESDDAEKDSYAVFERIKQNLSLLDDFLLEELCQCLAQKLGFFIINQSDVTESIRKLQLNEEVFLQVVEAIFRSQRDLIKSDVQMHRQSSKKLESIVQSPDMYLSSKIPVLKAAVKGLVDENAAIQPIKKVVAIDHLYGLVQPDFVSPCLFANNLVMYSIARSRLISNIYGKLHPGGLYGTVKSFLYGLTLEVPKVPAGDILVAIDNDQVLVKKWTVRKENRAQVSVLTSVCCAQPKLNPDDLQQNKTLAPSEWINVPRERLLQDCSLTEEDNKILRSENKRFLQELMEKIVKEHGKTGNEWKDDIDHRVAEMKAKEGTRMCSACGTSVERSKRKCTNKECGVNLKAAEKSVTGTDVLGSALIAPVQKYAHRIRETQLGFTIEEGQARVFKEKEVWQSFDQWSHVPSGHPQEPVHVLPCDPIFVNPNSFESMKEVLRRVGDAAHIERYHPNSPNSRKWLSVTMDGLPYLVVRQVIDTVHICTACEQEVLKEQYTEHILSDSHRQYRGQEVKFIPEFDWVLLRIGKLHVEMNMAKSLVKVNWEVFFAEMAKEMGFLSESAQKFVLKCSDHHKTMSLIEIAHIGTWSELLTPYVKAKLLLGEELSVSDFLYTWVPSHALKCYRYHYMFTMAWKYLAAFKVFHIGVRRNNSSYVHAGQMGFASLFHRSNTSKYALIDLYDSIDRASYPTQLAEFVKGTESISTSGNSSKGEDMDACLEEVNKASKVWQHGTMNAIDWLKIFRNLTPLNKVRDFITRMAGLKDPREDAAVCRKRYDYQDEILAWRIRLRKERFLDPDYSTESFYGIGGKELDRSLVDLESTLETNRKNLLTSHFIEKKARHDTIITPIYVTKEDRDKAEDINNMTKADIIKRIEENILLISDEIVKEKFDLHMGWLKKKITSTKKEVLLSFYSEIQEELNDQSNQNDFVIIEVSDDDSA